MSIIKWIGYFRGQPSGQVCFRVRKFVNSHEVRKVNLVSLSVRILIGVFKRGGGTK